MTLGGDVVRVATDAAALARDAAEVFASAAGDAVRERGLFSVALAGGSTPRGLYSLLAGESFRARVPWTRTHFFWGDERHVPSDHPESNYRLVHETMLSRVGVPEDHIHRIRTELPDAAAAADAYEETLRGFVGPVGRSRPLFDLVLLGMGSDGHTASLFPGTDGLHETTRFVVANWVERLGSHRITLTVPALCSAAHVVFLVSGADKAATLREVLMVEAPTEALPASLIRPIRGGRLTWLVDQDAARLLEPGPNRGSRPGI